MKRTAMATGGGGGCGGADDVVDVDDDDLDDVRRRLPAAFVELPEKNGLGILGEELRAAGLEHLMAAVLKQRAFKWTGGVD